MQFNHLSVKQLNFYVRSLVEGDPKLNNVAVVGEISNFKNHYSSGHLYFTLKDNDASIRCVMFKSYAALLKFVPTDGQKVVLKGRVSIYEKDGQYQFYAEEMADFGLGDITLRFNQIKEKLEKEGMFEAENKRPIPKFPQKIAVVTSPTGAAVKDILNILSRRWPLAEVVLCPVLVQGEQAAGDMCDTLESIYSLSYCDVIIIGRGGGSIEDLWAFNDEKLARKIYESPIPVISAVGHETDFTICDFVADLRAPTPSAAAELAVPDISEIRVKVNKYSESLKAYLKTKYDLSYLRLEKIFSQLYFKNPKDAFIGQRSLILDGLCDRLNNAENGILSSAMNDFQKQCLRLDALSPLKTLSRGFSVASKDNVIVKNINNLAVGDKLSLRMTDGTADCEVKKIILNDGDNNE